MGDVGAGSFVTFLVLLFLAFVSFVVYFIFKQMQFVLTATNLYKKMVRRQDAVIKLLIDIRDGTKQLTLEKIPVDEDLDEVKQFPEVSQTNLVKCKYCGESNIESRNLCKTCGRELR